MEKTAMDELYGQTMAHAFVDELRELEKTAKLPGFIRNQLSRSELLSIKKGIIPPDSLLQRFIRPSERSRILQQVRGRRAGKYTNTARKANTPYEHDQAVKGALKNANHGIAQRGYTQRFLERERGYKNFSLKKTLNTPGQRRPSQLPYPASIPSKPSSAPRHLRPAAAPQPTTTPQPPPIPAHLRR